MTVNYLGLNITIWAILCVCTCVCGCICASTHGSIDTCGHWCPWIWMSEINFKCGTSGAMYCYILRQGLSLGPGTCWVGQAGWPASPRNPPVSFSPGLCHKHTPHLAFPWVLSTKIRSSCLHGKHLTNWTISPALCMTYVWPICLHGWPWRWV